MFLVLLSQPKRDFLSWNLYAAAKARTDFSREKVRLSNGLMFLKKIGKEAACHMDYQKSTPKSPPPIRVAAKISVTISGHRRPQTRISGRANTAFQCVSGPRDKFWDMCEEGAGAPYSSS